MRNVAKDKEKTLTQVEALKKLMIEAILHPKEICQY